ncbi:MAG: hypothetical protein IT384_23165 [Deltaproteobacteria bacterium]|nr:hypothetical protein [Deltaproteobacteria bacterium]
MSAGRILAVALCLIGSSCSRISFFEADVPADVRSLIIVLDGEEATDRRLIGPLAWSPGLTVPYDSAKTRRVTFLGFEAPLPAGTVREAVGCEPTLPPPSWIARAEPGGAVTVSATGARDLRLIGDWQVAACARALLDHDVLVRERPPYESTQVAPGGGCSIAIPRRLGDTEVCFDPEAQVLTTELPGCGAVEIAGALGALHCTSLDHAVDIEVRPLPPPADVEVTTLVVLPGAPVVTHTSGRRRTFNEWLPWAGYLADLEILERGVERPRLVVAVRPSPGVCDRTTALPTTLHLFDAETLAPLRTATTAPCVSKLLARPASSGFVALSEPDLLIQGFDVDLSPDTPPSHLESDRTRSFEPFELTALSDGRLAALYRVTSTEAAQRCNPSPDFDDYARVWIEGQRPQEIGVCYPMMIAAGDTGLIALRSASLVSWIAAPYDFSSVLNLELDTRLNGEAPLAGGALEVPSPAPARRAMLIVNRAEEPNLVLVENDGVALSERSRTTGLQPERAPFAVAPWPAHPSVVLVALSERRSEEPPRVFGALFDVAAGRYLRRAFSIEGMVSDDVPLGIGVVPRARVDSRGTTWLLLPWSASVTRLRMLGS